MSATPEKIVAASKANVEAGLKSASAFVTTVFTAAERVATLNLATARTAFDDSVAFSKAIMATKDPKALAALSIGAVTPSVEKSVAYGRSLSAISADTQEELTKLVEAETSVLGQNFDTALEVRSWDRLFDTIDATMTKVVMDNVRQEGQHDPVGVEAAKIAVRKVYTVAEAQLGDRKFIVGDSLTLADASAAPSLWYGTRNIPLDGAFPCIAAYLERLKAWPAFARAVKESEPLFHMYPGA